MHHSLNSSSEKDIKILVDKFENVEELQNEMSEIMIQYQDVDKIREEKMGTKNCKCEYCQQLGDKRTSGFLTPNSQKIFPFALEIQKATEGKVFYYD
jgi:flagellar biosynthesis chaperone FliJ